MQDCWKSEAKDRPEIKEVISRIEKMQKELPEESTVSPLGAPSTASPTAPPWLQKELERGEVDPLMFQSLNAQIQTQGQQNVNNKSLLTASSDLSESQTGSTHPLLDGSGNTS